MNYSVTINDYVSCERSETIKSTVFNVYGDYCAALKGAFGLASNKISDLERNEHGTTLHTVIFDDDGRAIGFRIAAEIGRGGVEVTWEYVIAPVDYDFVFGKEAK